jgi:hypothetical protein
MLCSAGSAQTVWSGLSFSFTNPGGIFPPPANHIDAITANVALARGNTEGIYNAVKESSWNNTSPVDTQWATDINNPGKMISAANFASLEFDSWLDAYGGSGQVGRQIIGRNAVLRLVPDNIYLDIRFTGWGQRSGGAFSYMRATGTVAPPMATGDYNGNGVVDAADYVVWRDSLDQMVTPAGSGADGNANGTIDDADYDFWRARFGNTAPGSASGLGLAAVPEPAALFIALASLPLVTGCRCSFRRG